MIIDLGEDGQILIEAESTHYDDDVELSGIREIVEPIKVNAEKLLKIPLTGLAKMFLAILPYASSSDEFQLDEFSVEFNIGIKVEAGTSFGAIAKIMPDGAFKCTYKWRHRES